MRVVRWAAVVVAVCAAVAVAGNSVSAVAAAKRPALTAPVKTGCVAKRASGARAVVRSRAARARAARARRACLARRAAARTAALPAAVEPVGVAPEDGKLAFVADAVATSPELAAPAAPGATDAVGVPAPPPAPVPVASTLGVDAYDFGSFVLRMTRTAVPAGSLTIYFRNHDSSDHNLWIEGPGLGAPMVVSEAVGENGGATKTLPVVAGSWRLYCSLPGHDAMSRTLTVG